MPEDPTTDAGEQETPAPKKTVFYENDEHSMPSWAEAKETGKEIKHDVISFIGEDAVEIVTQPARATVTNVLDRIRNGINAFLAPAGSSPTCGHTTSSGQVCGRRLPCRYPSHRRDE